MVRDPTATDREFRCRQLLIVMCALFHKGLRGIVSHFLATTVTNI